jgi:hypothetical protein
MLFVEQVIQKAVADLRRKAKVALHTAKRGDWADLSRRVERNLKPISDWVSEAYILSKHAISYRYRNGGALDRRAYSEAKPHFTAHPIHGRSKNVILIMLDALRQDIFDAYLRRGGFSTLMAQGVYFPNAFSQGSWTYPSVFSYLTGLYPFNCGVSRIARKQGHYVSLCGDFDEKIPTVFTILREHGYQVGSILDGWGFTIRDTAGQGHREDRYFEENWGWIYGQDRRFLPLTELRESTLDYVSRVTGHAPFALYVRSLYTHSPYTGIFKNADYVIGLSRRRWLFRLVEGFIDALWRFEHEYLDPLLGMLERVGERENTIIVIHSDHGEMLWNLERDLRAQDDIDDEMWRHQAEPYNALTRVPLLISEAAMRGVYLGRFRLVDLLPTLLDELCISYEHDQFDGISVRREAARPLYADSSGNGFGGISFQAGEDKLLMSNRLGAAAYRLGEGDYEQASSRTDGRYLVEAFAQFLEQNVRFNQALQSGDDPEEALAKRLRALGYID